MGWEAAFTAVAVGLSFVWPRIGSRPFRTIERQFHRLANRRHLSILVVGLSVLVLRFSILPLLPVPMPFTADDYSNLLAADTFSHGRLANPTPSMWVHFESIHIDMRPTYTSMYFPGQGMLMAAGKALFGNFWLAVPFAAALMCSALCWMLRGWLPAPWALLGGFIAVLRLGVFSYWTNTYHTAGTLAALGGALILGAMPRLQRSPETRYGLIMAAGAVLLVITRPYEGVLLCLVVGIALIRSEWKRPLLRTTLIRAAVPGVVLLSLGIAWLGFYDFRAFGNPLTPPYAVNRATYATAPYYVWQKPRREPAYSHPLMHQFYKVYELEDYERVHSLAGLPSMTMVKALRGILFFSGVVFLPALFMLPWALRDRRIRLLVISLVVLAWGMVVEIYLFPHYLAPFAAAFYAVGIQCMRHLWQWHPGRQPVGRAMVRLTVLICVLMAGIRVFDRQLGCPVPGYPFSTWICNWFGPDHFVSRRELVKRRLEQHSGGQLAIVRYSPDHDALDEWVYNSADIDSSKVIWAWDMGDTANQELIRYYKDRKVWLVQPDAPSAEVTPYQRPGSNPVPAQVTRASAK